MGPLAADAVKVFGGRSWSLPGLLIHIERFKLGNFIQGTAETNQRMPDYGKYPV